MLDQVCREHVGLCVMTYPDRCWQKVERLLMTFVMTINEKGGSIPHAPRFACLVADTCCNRLSKCANSEGLGTKLRLLLGMCGLIHPQALHTSLHGAAFQ